MTRVFSIILTLFALFTIGVSHGQANAGADILKQAKSFEAGIANRFHGSAGNDATVSKIANLLKDSKRPWGAVRYEQPVFTPGKATLSVDGKAHAIHSFYPNLTDLSHFEERKFTAPLVYVGRGTLDEVEGKNLKGAVVLIEFDCTPTFLDLLSFGVKGFVFIEPSLPSLYAASQKIFIQPISAPRYQISKAVGEQLKAQAIKQGSLSVTIESEKNRFDTKELKNLWAFIPGADETLSENIIIITADMDATHYCPELETGGVATLNLYAAVEFFKKYNASPAPYSLLFHFPNSSIQDNAGLAHLVHASFAKSSIIFGDEESDGENEEQTLRDGIKEANYIIDVYNGLTPDKLSQALIDDLIERIERPARRNLPALHPLQRQLDFDIFQLEQARAKVFHDHDENHPEYKHISSEITRIGKVVELFKKFGTGLKLDEVDDVARKTLDDYRLRVIKQNQARIKRANHFLALMEDIKPLRAVLGDRTPLVTLEIDLSYGHQHVGLFSRSNYGRGWFLGNVPNRNSPFPDHVGQHIEQTLGKTFPSMKWESDNLNILAGSRIQKTMVYWRNHIPAYAFRNAYDRNDRLMTSADTLSALDPTIVGSNFAIMKEAVNFVLHSEKNKRFLAYQKPQKAPTKDLALKSGFFVTRIKDGSSLTEPETVMKNGLVVAFGRRADVRQELGVTGGKFTYRLYDSGETGMALFRSMPITNSFSPLRIEVYHLNEQGKIDMVLDHGSSTRKLDTRIRDTKLFKSRHLLPGIQVEKADVFHAYLPHGLAHPKTVTILGAKGRFIQDYHTAGVFTPTYAASGEAGVAHLPITLFFPPGERIRLQFERGTSFLANVQGSNPDNDLGFSAAELHHASLPRLMAADAQRLNTVRKDTLEAKAVTNNLITTMHNLAGEYFEGEGKHLSVKTSGDSSPKATQANAQRALGSAYSTYPMIRSSLTDMIKAVVFYMAILLPFSYFMQKLLFNFTKVESQLVAFLFIFFGIYTVFHFIHPAFQLTKNPQVIIISFATLVLTGFVISVLRNKFDYHMKDFGGKFSVDDSSTLKLAGKAFTIGVSNMRRRKIRTTLTCVTIIFITFTMLSFTSVTQSVNPSLVAKEGQAPYDGLYISHVVMGPLSPDYVNTVETLVGEGNTVKRKMRSVSFNPTGGNMMAFNPKRNETLELAGAIGLMTEEDGFIGKMPIVAGRYFNPGETRAVVITRKMAEGNLFEWDLSKEGAGKPLTRTETLIVDGMPLPVVGIVDGEVMATMKDQRGFSLIPQEVATSGSKLNADQVAEDEELPEGSLRDVEISRFVVLPYALEGLGLTTVSISIKLKDSAQTWESVTDLVIQSGLRFYFGCKEAFALNPTAETPVFEKPGRYYLKSGFDTSIGGLASLIIPLLVSATIIFNTMLSAVHERKKEIGVYNSIGLNPVHIGLFFIAESVVYGIVGSVAGYLLGQVFAKLIIVLGWFQDLNINYSSTSVVYVILFTIVIVVLSSLYPAWVAMKTATTSSGQKKQKIDHGNEIDLTFPFSFNEKAIYAVNAYVREYMNLHADQSVGGFMATERSAPHIEGDKANKEIVYEYEVSLVPFDLGVLQHVKFRSYFNKTVGAYMLETITERQAGTDSNWLATNRPFSNGIRKYLLRWRALSTEAQDDYFAMAKESLNQPALQDASA